MFIKSIDITDLPIYANLLCRTWCEKRDRHIPLSKDHLMSGDTWEKRGGTVKYLIITSAKLSRGGNKATHTGKNMPV